MKKKIPITFFKNYLKDGLTRSHIIAEGNLYPEDNVQLNWIETVGWTQQQFHSISQCLRLSPNVKSITIVLECPEDDAPAPSDAPKETP